MIGFKLGAIIFPTDVLDVEIEKSMGDLEKRVKKYCAFFTQ
jgi:hypothetical protein